MKRIIFTLLALVGTMSMNAQVTPALKVMKDGKVVKTYTAAEADEFVFEDVPATTGTATRTGSISVNWVQLWEGGPKFAEYNIGATSATEYGGYYTWGGTYKNGADITWNDDHNKDESNLSCTGNNLADTATKHWGDNWRMPKKDELKALINSTNCIVEWIDGSTKKYNNTSVTGFLCTGKGAYSSNSVFLPAAGRCNDGDVEGQDHGYYWSSTPYNSDDAYVLHFYSGTPSVGHNYRYLGYSVRAVLAE